MNVAFVSDMTPYLTAVFAVAVFLVVVAFTVSRQNVQTQKPLKQTTRSPHRTMGRHDKV